MVTLKLKSITCTGLHQALEFPLWLEIFFDNKRFCPLNWIPITHSGLFAFSPLLSVDYDSDGAIYIRENGILTLCSQKTFTLLDAFFDDGESSHETEFFPLIPRSNTCEFTIGYEVLKSESLIIV